MSVANSLGKSFICRFFNLWATLRLVSLSVMAICKTSMISDFVLVMYVSAAFISSCIIANCEFVCFDQRLIMPIKWFMNSLSAGSEKEAGRSMHISVSSKSAFDSAEENESKRSDFNSGHVRSSSGAPSNLFIIACKGPRMSRWAMAVFRHSVWKNSLGVFIALMRFSVSAMKA